MHYISSSFSTVVVFSSLHLCSEWCLVWFSSLHLRVVCFTTAHLSRGEWRHPVAEIHYWCQSAQIPGPRSAAIWGVWSSARLDKWSRSHQLMSAQVNSSQFIWTHDAQGQFKHQSEHLTGLYVCLHEWTNIYVSIICPQSKHQSQCVFPLYVVVSM